MLLTSREILMDVKSQHSYLLNKLQEEMYLCLHLHDLFEELDGQPFIKHQKRFEDVNLRVDRFGAVITNSHATLYFSQKIDISDLLMRIANYQIELRNLEIPDASLKDASDLVEIHNSITRALLEKIEPFPKPLKIVFLKHMDAPVEYEELDFVGLV